MPLKIVDEIDVTVIVPIYNGEPKNLSRCIDSIVGQTLKSIEILLLCDDTLQDAVNICNKYASNDRRISVMTLKNSNIGQACNQGILKSSGKYISFVEPNDWLETEMCQSMLNQALKYDTDVAITYHYDVFSDGDRKALNKELVWNPSLLDVKLTDRFAIPNFYLKWAYCWGYLYKKEFLVLNSIRFREAANQINTYDLSFAYLVFCNMKSFCILRASLYNHYLPTQTLAVENPLTYALNLLNIHSYIFDISKEIKTDVETLKLEAARSLHDIIQSYNLLRNLSERIGFLKNASLLLFARIDIYLDNQYINQHDKCLVKKYSSSPSLTAFLDRRNAHIKICRFLINLQFKNKVTHIKILSFPVLFIKNTPDYKTFNICMVPIRRNRVTKNLDGSLIVQRIYYFGFRLFKKTITPKEIKTYFLNLMVRRKINIEEMLKSISNRLDSIPSENDILYYASLATEIANTHNKIFPQFKNSNIGKSVAIFGAGPTLNYAPQIKKCKIIACNRSYEYLLERGCDYFFAQDYHGIKSFYEKAMQNTTYAFLGRNADKFYVNTTPEQYRNIGNMHSYYFHTNFYDSIRIKSKIESFPLADFYTVVHPALHFALYTNPKIIYLIGCDTSTDGYANKNILQFRIRINNIIDGYKKLKELRDLEYPETRIVSVNPIGLRNIFEDVYTESFVNYTGAVDKENITLIEEI